MLSLPWQLQGWCGLEFGPPCSPEFPVHFPSSRCVDKKLGLRANVGSTEWVCLRRTERVVDSPQPCLKNSHLEDRNCHTSSTIVHDACDAKPLSLSLSLHTSVCLYVEKALYTYTCTCTHIHLNAHLPLHLHKINMYAFIHTEDGQIDMYGIGGPSDISETRHPKTPNQIETREPQTQ